MTTQEYDIIRKALNKSRQLGIGLEETVNLIKMYEEIAKDISGEVLIAPTAGLFANPAPPPVYDESAREAAPQSKISTFSATASLSRQKEPAYVERSIDQIFDEIMETAPKEISVLAPGYKHPMRFHVDPYKSEATNTAGIIFATYGDRTQVAGKIVYQTDKPYDINKDIEEFKESTANLFRARNAPVVSRTPAPRPFSMDNADSMGGVTVTAVDADRAKQELIRAGKL